jgi:hypothetical protein
MTRARYVGESVFLRVWPPTMLGIGLAVLVLGGLAAFFLAVVFFAVGLGAARLLPWRFAVVDEGLVLWFPFARRTFLARDQIVVRVDSASAVAMSVARPRFRYPLTDGLVERRNLMLRSVLIEHGFRVT